MHNRICQFKKCPSPTFGRLSDPVMDKRRDFCLEHFDAAVSFFHDLIDIVETWGVRPPPIENEEVDKVLELINDATKEYTNG
jgi:hypothetical protein